ncbi:AarF domain-containing kinase isoform 1 [Dorcoceras hygrometricum]|uniref:AarF domain-containing kinase isoform 1 n=1 Tax=Dorcoceras hygrometricum TaxID=472368 RepID=A0A2Z7DDT7_9LAMI|nr:AarF domain-containing kinase isoform 1 [Dorcoceras hygrometricum]
MSRFLTDRNVWRVSQSSLLNRFNIYSKRSKLVPFDRAGFNCSLQYRFYQQRSFPSRRHVWNATRGVGKGFCNGFIRQYSVLPLSNTIAHHAGVAWKRLPQVCAHSGLNHLPLHRMAQAVVLALSNSFMVVPGIFALVCGAQVAWAQDLEDKIVYRPTDTLYNRALDSHLFLAKLALSMLDGLLLLLRAMFLVVLFTPSIAMAPFADSFGPQFRELWLHVVHQTLERAGPAFIKWGQWAATRPDLFPRDLCGELSKLHTKAPEHSFAYTKKTIEKAFGCKISDIFDDFEPEPVASGSIAQVHRASLRPRYPGRQAKPLLVAVKVRHPGVGESIKRDFEIITIVAKISNFIPALNWLRLDESVQQFAVFMMGQVDLSREASHLSRFIYNFRAWKDVSFPKPVYPFVHPAVLVETFEHGESVSYFVDELEGNERLKSSLAHIGTHALLKMLLVEKNRPGKLCSKPSLMLSSLMWE